MARESGMLLLSALRKHKSKSAVLETPDLFFEEGAERNAFYWLRDYVSTHNAFPTPRTFEREAGVLAGLVSEPLSYYLDDARKKALWESLFEPFANIRKCMDSKDPDGALAVMQQVQVLANQLNHRKEGITTFAQSMRLIELDYEEAKRTAGGLRGIPTGWEFTDQVTNGYQNGNVITIVGRPKRGKTQIMLKKLQAAHNAGYSALFFSGEMGALSLARRFLGLQTRMNPKFIRRGELSSYQQTEFYRNINLMADSETPLHWLAGNFKQTLPAITAAVHENEPDIIFLDASYLVKPNPSSGKYSGRREVVADVIEQIGELSRSIDRPIVQSVQFNRTAEKPKKSEDEEERSNPLAHLSLAKIGETDTIGQVSSIVYGIDLGDAPNARHERYLGFLAGREGEEGWMKFHYRFQPVNMDEITNSSKRRTDDPIEAPNLDFMDYPT